MKSFLVITGMLAVALVSTQTKQLINVKENTAGYAG